MKKNHKNDDDDSDDEGKRESQNKKTKKKRKAFSLFQARRLLFSREQKKAEKKTRGQTHLHSNLDNKGKKKKKGENSLCLAISLSPLFSLLPSPPSLSFLLLFFLQSPRYRLKCAFHKVYGAGGGRGAQT